MAGISPDEETVYRAVLGLPPFTIAGAAQACTQTDRAAPRSVLGSLIDKGLLTRISERPRR